MLVIGVEANLTRSDAYFTGLAAQFDEPTAFHRSLVAKIRRRGKRDKIFRRFGANLEQADPLTLWTLGRSIYANEDPGAAFRHLRCPRIYYWDATRSTSNTRAYVERYKLPNRRLDHLGHWPMISSPDVFYSAVAEDIRTRSAALTAAGRD
jgi:pimeloyl-ACP methyl ester carboxylesterase